MEHTHDAVSLQLLAAAISGGAAHAQNITRQEWGTTDKGEQVELFTLKGANGLEARITNFGGRVVDLYVPNAHGGKTDVELGFDDFAVLLPQGQHLWRPGRPLCRAASAMAAAFR